MKIMQDCCFNAPSRPMATLDSTKTKTRQNRLYAVLLVVVIAIMTCSETIVNSII